jgi:hypothetical protein
MPLGGGNLMEQNTESTAAKTGAQAAPAKKGGRKAKALARKPAKGRKSAKPAAKRAGRKPDGKGSRKTVRSQVIALLQRKDGATLPELCKAFGWQKHTVRGFISILGSNGHKVESTRVDGVRTYRIK